MSINIYEDIYNNHGLSLTQKRIIDLVGDNKTILEIGASSGYMTELFLKNNCKVDVIEVDKNAASDISKKTRKIIYGSIEEISIINQLNKDYDFIVLADVIEHLVDPQKVLKNLKMIATKKTKLLLSTPNIAYWAIRKELFFEGSFEYQESGILDKTHLHFYTTKTLPKLLTTSGWKVDELIGTIIRIPFEGVISKTPILNLFLNFLKDFISKKYNNLSFVHLLAIASI